MKIRANGIPIGEGLVAARLHPFGDGGPLGRPAVGSTFVDELGDRADLTDLGGADVHVRQRALQHPVGLVVVEQSQGGRRAGGSKIAIGGHR